MWFLYYFTRKRHDFRVFDVKLISYSCMNLSEKTCLRKLAKVNYAQNGIYFILFGAASGSTGFIKSDLIVALINLDAFGISESDNPNNILISAFVITE